jgi:hypothetical protein
VAIAMLARDATFTGLAAATLMLAFSFAPALALTIGANIALLFTIALLLRAACLSEDRIERTEVWRSLDDRERPVGDAGRKTARDELQDALLRFARAASGAAIVLYAMSLYLSPSADSRSLHAVVSLGQG